MGAVTSEELDAVFGKDSIGATAAERAKTSTRRFVRSQVQIALASDRATGRVLSAFEALQTFGWDILLQVASEGSARLIRSAQEPAATLKGQREQLGLSMAELARRTGTSEADVAKAETPGSLSSIRVLERLGAALALDERRLGHQPNAGRDNALGVRLRELRQADAASFGPGTVLSLSEAAWVISRQDYLSKALGFRSMRRVALPPKDPIFNAPPFKLGYALAERTRALIGLSEIEPIVSLRVLIEEVLELPLVQQAMNDRFAGATIANGSIRGIVVNESGMNANVWVRRLTMCHEVGHLLWDPDSRLEKLKVDQYADLEVSALDQRADPVEARANAFAVAFLAPQQGVLQIANSCQGDPTETVTQVMLKYGISAAAAKHHVYNVAGLQTAQLHSSSLPTPANDWVSAEDMSIAFFPIDTTPITRRGKFAWFVAKALASGLITDDTAASYLKCEKGEISEHLNTITGMWP